MDLKSGKVGWIWGCEVFAKIEGFFVSFGCLFSVSVFLEVRLY